MTFARSVSVGLAGLCFALPACGEPEPKVVVAPVVAPPPVAPPVWKATWPEKQPALRPTLVRLVVENATAEPVELPDLAKRPWLVRFFLIDSSNTPKQTGTHAPDVDPGGTITVAPGGREEVLLQVPGVAREGTYRLEVRITNDRVGEGALVLAPFAPAWLDARSDALLWVDDTPSEAIVWMRSGDPLTTGAPEIPIATLPLGARPHWVVGDEQALVWQENDRVVFARVVGGLRLAPSDGFAPPWPGAEAVLDAVVLDGQGALWVPFRVPQPSGVAFAIGVGVWDTAARSSRFLTMSEASDAPASLVGLRDGPMATFAVWRELSPAQKRDAGALQWWVDGLFPAQVDDVTRFWADGPSALVAANSGGELFHFDARGTKLGTAKLTPPEDGAEIDRAFWTDRGPAVFWRSTTKSWLDLGPSRVEVDGALEPLRLAPQGDAWLLLGRGSPEVQRIELPRGKRR